MPEDTTNTESESSGDRLLEFDNIRQTFHSSKESIVAVKDVTISVGAGEVLCLVGQSGSGKSTLAKIGAGLRKPSSGEVRYNGRDIYAKENKKSWREYRRAVQYVHQDPYASLNPIQNVYATLAAPLLKHKLVKNAAEAEKRVGELLAEVDLKPAKTFIAKFPHQMSGGQRQRVAVARALTLGPKLILADEATSMLDVSIRVGLLNMLTRLRVERNVGFLFITHDLAMAKYFGAEGQMAVMHQGEIVEHGPTLEVIENPQHPYTEALLEAVPEPDPDLAHEKRAVRRAHEKAESAA